MYVYDIKKMLACYLAAICLCSCSIDGDDEKLKIKEVDERGAEDSTGEVENLDDTKKDEASGTKKDDDSDLKDDDSDLKDDDSDLKDDDSDLKDDDSDFKKGSCLDSKKGEDSGIKEDDDSVSKKGNGSVLKKGDDSVSKKDEASGIKEDDDSVSKKGNGSVSKKGNGSDLKKGNDSVSKKDGDVDLDLERYGTYPGRVLDPEKDAEAQKEKKTIVFDFKKKTNTVGWNGLLNRMFSTLCFEDKKIHTVNEKIENLFCRMDEFDVNALDTKERKEYVERFFTKMTSELCKRMEVIYRKQMSLFNKLVGVAHVSRMLSDKDQFLSEIDCMTSKSYIELRKKCAFLKNIISCLKSRGFLDENFSEKIKTRKLDEVLCNRRIKKEMLKDEVEVKQEEVLEDKEENELIGKSQNGCPSNELDDVVISAPDSNLDANDISGTGNEMVKDDISDLKKDLLKENDDIDGISIKGDINCEYDSSSVNISGKRDRKGAPLFSDSEEEELRIILSEFEREFEDCENCMEECLYKANVLEMSMVGKIKNENNYRKHQLGGASLLLGNNSVNLNSDKYKHEFDLTSFKFDGLDDFCNVKSLEDCCLRIAIFDKDGELVRNNIFRNIYNFKLCVTIDGKKKKKRIGMKKGTKLSTLIGKDNKILNLKRCMLGFDFKFTKSKNISKYIGAESCHKFVLYFKNHKNDDKRILFDGNVADYIQKK